MDGTRTCVKTKENKVKEVRPQDPTALMDILLNRFEAEDVEHQRSRAGRRGELS